MTVFRSGQLAPTEVFQWLLDLRGKPNVPESGFDVTSVFRIKSGLRDDYYFAGVNVENHDHRLSTHGEEGAIAAAVTALGKGAELVEGWVMGAPRNLKSGDDVPLAKSFVACCGKCRQQIAGLATPDLPIHEVTLNGQTQTVLLRDTLPNLFSFRNFIPDLQTAQTLSSAAPDDQAVMNKLVRTGPLTKNDIFSWLSNLQSIDYASGVAQSAVLQLDNGAFVAGTKVEEAAFQDISCTQAAVAIAHAHYGPVKVKEAWVYTQGSDGKEMRQDRFGTLPLSALQTLLQVADNGNIMINYFAPDGRQQSAVFSEACKMAATSASPTRGFAP